MSKNAEIAAQQEVRQSGANILVVSLARVINAEWLGMKLPQATIIAIGLSQECPSIYCLCFIYPPCFLHHQSGYADPQYCYPRQSVAMLGLDVANFVYPSPGYVYPSSSCNATWRQMLATADVDNMSYPPNDPSSAAAMNVAALICRFSDDKRISNTAWQAYAYLSSYGCMLTLHSCTMTHQADGA